MQLNEKQFEIFCGTGGVGKTTLATSRATFLSSQNKKVLLITIDPAKRLKEVLNISDENAGDVITIKNPCHDNSTLDVLLMNPNKTMQTISALSGVEEIKSNRILKVLSKPYGGLNEILSVIELNMHYKKNIYDVIVLDTPPGSHFLDFLESCGKIKAFFDKSFMEIFNYLGKKAGSKKPGIFKVIVTTGVRKLLSYLQKVTGAQFIDDFIDAVSAIYMAKEPFMGGISIQENLKNQHLSNWFLVTSVDQDKFEEALDIKAHASEYFHDDTYLLVNKSLMKKWENFETQNPIIQRIQDNNTNKELNISKLVQNNFKKVLFFEEVIAKQPLEHVCFLSKNWQQH